MEAEIHPPPPYEEGHTWEGITGGWTGSIKWKAGLALVFVVVNSLWLLRNTLAASLDSSWIDHLQWTLNTLGFLLARLPGEGQSGKTIIYLCAIQILISLLLLKGIVKRKVYILEQWIFLTGVMGMLNCLYHLDLLCHIDSIALESPLALLHFLLPVLGYYFFNGVYCWQIYELRQKFLMETDPRSGSGIGHPKICSYSHEMCLSFTALLSSVIYLILLALLFHSWQKPQFVNYIDYVFTSPVLFFIVLGIGMVLSIIMLRANIQSQGRGIILWIIFQVFLGLVVFGMLSHEAVACELTTTTGAEPEKSEFNKNLMIFFILEFPIVLMLWVGYSRLKEIKRERTVQSDEIDLRGLYISSSQTATLNVGYRA